MNVLIQQIFENKEVAALPSLLESGGLPALVSGLSAVQRAFEEAVQYQSWAKLTSLPGAADAAHKTLVFKRFIEDWYD